VIAQFPLSGHIRTRGRQGKEVTIEEKMEGSRLSKILTLFGTRPEVIKLSPVIRRFEEYPDAFTTINVSSSQHTDLLRPLTEAFGVRIDHDLRVMRDNQSPDEICARVLTSLKPILEKVRPDMIVLQGDTTTAMAGALSGFTHQIPVAHVEAGLRSGNPFSPFPEEMNRRLISQLASYHFAATERNRATLLREGIPDDSIFVTGNPVVDALLDIMQQTRAHGALDTLLDRTNGYRRIVLTTHRRESLGQVMRQNLAVLRRYIEAHEDVALLFPVHPNPSVVESARNVLSEHPRIHLIEPLDYHGFVHLLSQAWLIVSDSGGVQEEAPTLGKPLLVIRENTERPEAVEAGVARLVGGDPETLATILNEIEQDDSWIEKIGVADNPFGRGDSAVRIVSIVADLLNIEGFNESSNSGVTRESIDNPNMEERVHNV
jgi:UDP-N-acetylglucosamine 2-epimerase (non-hydrolysing)